MDRKWDQERVKGYVNSWIKALNAQVEYLEDNRADMAHDEEEFTLCLTQGLGMSDEEVKEIIDEIFEEKEKT